MSGNLNGKSALVTGGSRGIGAAIAKRLAADGANVAITFNSNKGAADAVVADIEKSGVKGVALQADAADPDAAARAVAETKSAFGGFDILVHNAGYAQFATIAEDTFENYRGQFSVNVDGVFAGTRAAADHISDGGRIIVIGSVNAHTVPVP
ncbi:MAG: SDR family NAD(P)-dependent oxidoreductase, partial [Pseudomonadota bacterium]